MPKAPTATNSHHVNEYAIHTAQINEITPPIFAPIICTLRSIVTFPFSFLKSGARAVNNTGAQVKNAVNLNGSGVTSSKGIINRNAVKNKLT